MKDQNCEEETPHRGILHQTKQKYKQLNSSLLLTSSLISHKQKISLLRKQNAAFPSLPSCKGLLKASKMNLQETKCLQEQPQQSLSNIQELKFLARKLDQEHITKLGKQNKKVEDSQKDVIIPLCQTEIEINRGIPKKINKRRIIKGRPQMHVYVKKRKILNAIIQVDRDELQNTKGKFRETIGDILNKNKLLTFITTKNVTGNNNLYDNFLKQKQEEFLDCSHSKNKTNFRRSSAVSFKNYGKTRYNNRFRLKEQDQSKEREWIGHVSLGHKRHSTSQTIQ